VSGNLTAGCQVGILFKVDDPTLNTLNKLGLVNLPLVLWNLSSLSFVVDWFFSVSNYLRTLASGIGLDFHSGYTTYFVKTNLTFVQTAQRDYFGGGYYLGTWPGFHMTEKAMQRVPLYTFPKPRATFATGLSGTKIVTLAALASSLLSSRT